MIDAPETDVGSRSNGAPVDPPRFADAVRGVSFSLAEFAKYAQYLLSLRIDQLKLSVRSLLIWLVIGIFSVVSVSVVLVVSVTLLLIGVAHGLAAAIRAPDWVGDALLGLVVIAAVVISMNLLLAKIKTASRRGTIRKYEDRRRKQREQFGRGVAERAAEL